MNELSVFALILALIWGVCYARFLQSKSGKFLTARLTWLTVVIGNGVNLLIARLVVGGCAWNWLIAIFVLSGIPIIWRSLKNDQIDTEDVVHAK
jgi:hypothetical protein